MEPATFASSSPEGRNPCFFFKFNELSNFTLTGHWVLIKYMCWTTHGCFKATAHAVWSSVVTFPHSVLLHCLSSSWTSHHCYTPCLLPNVKWPFHLNTNGASHQTTSHLFIDAGILLHPPIFSIITMTMTMMPMIMMKHLTGIPMALMPIHGASSFFCSLSAWQLATFFINSTLEWWV